MGEEQCAHGVKKCAEGGHCAVSLSTLARARFEYSTRNVVAQHESAAFALMGRENGAVVLVVVVQFVDRRVSFVTNVLAAPNMSF